MNRDQAQALIITQVLTGYTFNAEAIVAKLAALDPVMLVRLANLDPQQLAWVCEAQRAHGAGEAIAGIRAIRTGTGMGLWEAKQVWDRMRNPGVIPCEESLWTEQMEEVYSLVKL